MGSPTLDAVHRHQPAASTLTFSAAAYSGDACHSFAHALLGKLLDHQRAAFDQLGRAAAHDVTAAISGDRRSRQCAIPFDQRGIARLDLGDSEMT
jgi:hypothetical protein